MSYLLPFFVFFPSQEFLPNDLSETNAINDFRKYNSLSSYLIFIIVKSSARHNISCLFLLLKLLHPHFYGIHSLKFSFLFIVLSQSLLMSHHIVTHLNTGVLKSTNPLSFLAFLYTMFLNIYWKHYLYRIFQIIC